MKVNRSSGRQFIWYLCVLGLLIVSLLIRRPEFRSLTGTENFEATYHALLTIRALEENPAQNSWYLPTVSLGGEQNKDIPWGATVRARHGTYIYTSFPPLGFLSPLLFFKILGWLPTLGHLTAFNCFLGVICALLLFWILQSILMAAHAPASLARLSALVGVSVLVFSREGLQSFGLAYWAQSLEQCFLVGQLCVLFHSVEEEGGSKLWRWVLFAVSFFSAWNEWSGIVANVFLCGILLTPFSRRQIRNAVNLAILVGVATFLAVGLIYFHFVLALGGEAARAAFLWRFQARSVLSGGATINGLLQGYVRSYGLFIVLLVTAFAWEKTTTERIIGEKKEAHWVLVFFALAACSSLPENILILQHATQFSFDRLKLALPLAILVAILFSSIVQRSAFRFRTAVFLLLLLLCIVQNICSFRQQNARYSGWPSFNNQNLELKSQLSRVVDLRCALFGSDGPIRGYANLLFGRGIFENMDRGSFERLVAERRNCGAVFLRQFMVFPDLQWFTEATVFPPRGKEFTVTPYLVVSDNYPK